ncbi:hypothetical protein GCM10027093_19610 [Paraburkholderia jirisanensis]
MSKAKTTTYQILMKRNDRKTIQVDESTALAAAYALAQQMFEVGGIDKKTMREFDHLCLPEDHTSAAR